MKVELQNRSVIVIWKHDRYKRILGPKGKLINGKELKDKSTTCEIISSENVILGIGMCMLHKGDKYDKNVGRKLSLKYALENAVEPINGEDICLLNREERSAIWNKYFDGTIKDAYNKKIPYGDKASRRRVQESATA